MPTEVAKGLGEFFDYVWQQTKGYVQLATLEKGHRDSFRLVTVEWPKYRNQIIRYVLKQDAAGLDVYYGPALLKEPGKASKDNILGSHVAWSEFDNRDAPASWDVVAKEKGIPEPTLGLQSSVEGNEHVYWLLNEFDDSVERIEDRNRAISYRLGADTSGWDANQLLRPPFTTNYGYRGTPEGGERKPWFTGDTPTVSVKFWTEGSVDKAKFGNLQSPEREYLDRLQLGDIPSIMEVLALNNWSPELLQVFRMSQEEAANSSPGKRSAALMRLAYMGAEQGFSDESIYAILDDADKRWDKYVKRSPATREKILRDTIARARAKIGYPTEELTLAGLLGATPVEQDDLKVVYNYREFLDTEIKVEWLLEGLLAQRGIGIITGHPGVGKTQFGIQLAMNLAIGTPKLLRWSNSAGPKKVLFLSLEMNHPSLKLFQETIEPAYTRFEQELTRNYNIAPIGDTIPLDTPAGQNLLDDLMREYKPDVLFIDSLQKMTNKALSDELASKALTDYLKTIRNRYETAIYFVHHNRKKGNDGAHIGELSDMYGSQFIAADVDWVLNLRKLGDSQIIAVDSWKNRLAPQLPTFEVTRNEHLQFSLYEGNVDGLAANATIINPSRDRGDEPRAAWDFIS